MASRRQAFTPNHPVVLTFLIIAVVAAMALAAEVLRPLALSILLCFALAPIARLLENRGLPRAVAVVGTVFLSLGILAGVGYMVSQQLSSLAYNLPKYEGNIREKLSILNPKQETSLSRAQGVAQHLASDLDEHPLRPEDVQKVEVVAAPSFQERFSTSVGPYVETLGVGSFVLILVLFMLMQRDDLSDRITRLFGRSHVILTTRTMDEVGQRISRYLVTFASVNSAFGLIVGVGLAIIGVPYAVLWGFLAAGLRFIPYVGPAAAFLLPVVFSVAYFPTWRQPLMVIGLFAAIEAVANTFLEPIIYGKTTGVSALGLLVAAMFWTWLWGPLGLLLSTPLTVCLAVLGKYVPSLSFFATLLGEEAELDKDVRYYQRLLALDQDGASEVVEEALRHEPRAQVLDRILVPALSRAERDYAREELDDREQAFIWRVTGDVIADLEDEPELNQVLTTANTAIAPPPDGASAAPADLSGVKILGVASNDTGDALVLQMLDLLVRPAGLAVELMTDVKTPLALAEAIADRKADLVVLSHLPPLGLTPARYLVRRLRARFPDLPIVVGRWGESRDAQAVAGRLTEAGATHVEFLLDQARDRLIALARKAAAARAEADAKATPVAVQAGAKT